MFDQIFGKSLVVEKATLEDFSLYKQATDKLRNGCTDKVNLQVSLRNEEDGSMTIVISNYKDNELFMLGRIYETLLFKPH